MNFSSAKATLESQMLEELNMRRYIILSILSKDNFDQVYLVKNPLKVESDGKFQEDTGALGTVYSSF